MGIRSLWIQTEAVVAAVNCLPLAETVNPGVEISKIQSDGGMGPSRKPLTVNGLGLRFPPIMPHERAVGIANPTLTVSVNGLRFSD